MISAPSPPGLHFPGEGLFSGLPPPCIPGAGYPLLARAVPAGPPAPAADRVGERLCLDAHLVEHAEATLFVRVAGDSMTGFGIHDGDLLLVDRALPPEDRSVVIAVVDGEFTVKQLCRIPEGVLLRSSGEHHGDILVGPEQQLAVWGVVRWSLHAVRPR